MKSIRVNTFETNSSSAHVLTFASKGSSVGRYGKLNWKGDEYDWEFEKYFDPQSKFSYYLAALKDWLWLMQKKEYGKRHNLEEVYYGCYSFSFGSLKEIAEAKEKNDEYWIKHYKEIDKENIEYIRNLAYDKVKGLFDFLKEKAVLLITLTIWMRNTNLLEMIEILFGKQRVRVVFLILWSI